MDFILSKKGVFGLGLAGLWIWREVSWSSHSKALELNRAELRDVLTNVYSMAIGANGACGESCIVDTEGEGEGTRTGGEYASLINSIVSLLQRFPYIIEYFDLRKKQYVNYVVFRSSWDLLVVGLMVCIMQYELLYCHDKKGADANAKQASIPAKYVARHMHLLYSRGYPLSNLCFFCFTFLLSCAAWTGLGVEREATTKRLLRITVLWFLSLILSAVVSNIRCMRTYMPQTNAELAEKAKSWTWWRWLLPRCLLTGPGMDLLSLGYSASNLVFYLLTIWPLRYMYVNQESSCGDSARLTDIFLSRMLMHLSLMAACYSYFSMSVVGFPPCLRAHKQLNTHYSAGIIIVSSISCVLSALWFALFGGGCGWWAAFVSLGFVIPQVMGGLSLALTVSSLIHKNHNFWRNLRASFVDSYMNQRMAQHSDCDPRPLAPAQQEQDKDKDKDKDKDVTQKEKVRAQETAMKAANVRRMDIIKDLNTEGEFLFDQLMSKACRYNLWLPSEVANTQSVTEDMDKGSLIFQCAFEDAIKVTLVENSAERERAADKSKE